jgi:glucose/arabinose dehydrogenase/plastocyanin
LTEENTSVPFRRILLPLLLVLAAVPATQGSSAATTITAASNRFLPADFTITEGEQIDFLNADVLPHNVISLPARNGGKFHSDTITQGKSAPVRGTSTLAPATYDFYCSLHPTMIGKLTVQPRRTVLVPHPASGTVPSPTSITIFREDMYVASYATNSIHKLPILPGGGLGPAAEYATGFDAPLGIVFDNAGTLYVSDSFQGTDRRYGRVRAIPPGGGAATRVGTVVLTDLPNGRHATNGLAYTGGRLYVANGNSTDDGRSGGPPETPLSGVILSVPANARNVSALRPPPGVLVVEARGLRNPYDLAFRPGTSEIWTATNGPDSLEPYGEDLLHKFAIGEPTIDFGFPACIHAASPRGPVVGQNPRVTAKCGSHRLPEQTLGLHPSADGLAFGPNTPGWEGDLFVAMFGSSDPPARGHEVVRVPVRSGRAGTPESVYSSSMPLDLTFGEFGMYVADFATGQITLLMVAE